MRSAAAAIAWEFRRRHRWGLFAVAGYLVLIGAIKLLILERGRPVDFDDERFALFVIVPLTTTFIYFLAVFSYGLSGDLAARQSMYPARIFTLPVTTAALSGWPMLYGTAAMAILWLATRFLAVWPSDVEVPSIWPALMAAALLAWTQALTWMPYGLPGLRVIVAVVWLAVIDAAVLLALRYRTSEAALTAGLLPLVPLAYLVARFAVARARRGEVPDWRGPFSRFLEVRASRRSPFSSPARAQAWLEWRRHGRSLPALVGILVPLELALLFLAKETPGFVFLILLAVLFTPPLMAAFAAATVRKSNPHASDSHGVTPFIATRPLTSAALIGAKLRATIRSTLLAWLLVLVAVPLALALSGTGALVLERLGRAAEAVGTARVIAVLLLAFAGLLSSTWKQLVQSLYIGLSGREWAVKASVFLTLSFLAVLGPLLHWIATHENLQAAIWRALPWILGVLACLKTGAAALIATRLHRGRVLSERALLAFAAFWLAAVLALYGLLDWLVSGGFIIPRYFLALVAILAIPLARLSAAPLALAWNRHR